MLPALLGWDPMARSRRSALSGLLSLRAARTGPNPAPSPAKPLRMGATPHGAGWGFGAAGGDEDRPTNLQPPHPAIPEPQMGPLEPQSPGDPSPAPQTKPPQCTRTFIGSRIYKAGVGGIGDGGGGGDGRPVPWLRGGDACPAAVGSPSARASGADLQPSRPAPSGSFPPSPEPRRCPRPGSWRPLHRFLQ